MATWKKVLVSGSAIEVRTITASNIPEGSNGSFLLVDSNGRLLKTGSGGGGGGIFVDRGDYFDTENTLFITGSTLLAAPTATNTTAVQNANNIAFRVSQSAHFYNHNAGYPTSNAWKNNLEGSYFNNFDSNTDVSEILRFIAGLLSSSATAPSANTNTFDSITSDLENETNTAAYSNSGTDYPAGKIPSASTDAEVLYTIDKGFSTVGEKLFENVTVTKYNDPDIYIRYNGNTSGTSPISSNSNFFGAGGLTNGAATNVRVTGSISYTYEDNNSNTSTATSSSQHVATYTNSTFGTQNGISVGKINTDNPSVIPPAFQDMDFANFADSQTKLFNTSNNNIDGRSKTDISSSGYYRWQASIAIQTGSQLDTSNYSTFRTDNDEIFWMPPNANIFSDLETALSSNDTSFTGYLVTSQSFTSRSLSGAPYLNAAQYDYFVTASDAFNPLYTAEANIVTANLSDGFGEDSTNGTDVTPVQSVFSNVTQNTSNGQITIAGVIFEGDTDMNSSVPHINSEIRLKSRTTLGTINGTSTNMTQTTSNAISDTMKTAFTVNKIDTDGSTGTAVTDTSLQHRPHLAGAFGQSVDSGSMALFLSNDGQDTSTNNQTTTVQEKFLGEKYRRAISDCTQASDLETAFDSGSYLSTSDPRPAQVKPGYLAIPGTTYGYWYPSSHYNSANYYWYLREVEFNVTTQQNTLTINFGPNVTLTDWATGGPNTISAGLIFESSIQGQGAVAGNPTLSKTRLFDLTKPGSATTDVSTGANNPFSSNIDIYGYPNGTAISSGTATIQPTAAAYQEMGTNSYTKIWLLVRQRGQTTNNLLQDVQFTVSS